MRNRNTAAGPRHACRLANIAVVPLLLALTACGDSGPGPDDVKNAANDVLNLMLGPVSPMNNHAVITEAKNLSCTQDANDVAFTCTYDLVANEPGKPAPAEEDGKKARFITESGKWAMLAPGQQAPAR